MVKKSQLTFLILDVGHHTWKTKLLIFNELLEYSRGYSNNQTIVEKAALGLYWASIIAKLYKQEQIQEQILKEITHFSVTYPSSPILSKITEFIK